MNVYQYFDSPLDNFIAEGVKAYILPNLIQLSTHQEFILRAEEISVEEISTFSCSSLHIDLLPLFSVSFLSNEIVCLSDLLNLLTFIQRPIEICMYVLKANE